jgi:cob(I)alamin adenosyltransferase
VDANVIAYVNRLSDYLFTLTRKLNVDENHPEIIWQRKK